MLVTLLVLSATGVWATASFGDGGPTPTGPSTGVRPAAVVYRPPALSTARKVPLLLALYGATGCPQCMEGLTHYEAIARQYGFVVAYPGSALVGGVPWQSSGDIRYIRSLISSIEASQNIDPTRVYVAGFSAGGRFAFQLGCALSKQITAIAVVSSVQRPYACPLSHPVSELSIIGSTEPVNGVAASGIPSSYTIEKWWRQRDGCTGSVKRAFVSPLSEQYSGSCVDGSKVGLLVVQGGQHTWPGCCGLPASDPDAQWNASLGIWAFFASHRMGSLTTPGAQLSALQFKGSGTSRRLAETFALGERVTVKQTLSGAGHKFAAVSTRLRPGRRVSSRLNVPSSAKPGSYTVALRITDAYGRTLKAVRKVRIT